MLALKNKVILLLQLHRMLPCLYHNYRLIKSSFLFGTEDQGLTEEAINAADQIVEIPCMAL